MDGVQLRGPRRRGYSPGPARAGAVPQHSAATTLTINLTWYASAGHEKADEVLARQMFVAAREVGHGLIAWDPPGSSS